MREENIKRKVAQIEGKKERTNKDGEREKQKQEWLREERDRSSSNSTTLGALAEIYK